MPENKEYTREEVKKSNGKGKTLIILHDKVYDVTVFLNEHPGGEEILLEHGGMDASDDFDDVSHSKDAMELMKTYRVGEIVESEKSCKTPKSGWATSSYNKKGQTESKSDLSFYLSLSSIAIFIAAIFYVYL